MLVAQGFALVAHRHIARRIQIHAGLRLLFAALLPLRAHLLRPLMRIPRAFRHAAAGVDRSGVDLLRRLPH